MKHKVSFELELKQNPYKGLLVALEGIDGSGKTTQVARLVEKLRKKGLAVINTTEPTTEPTGQFIRKILSGQMHVPPVALQYLFSADRAVHQEEIKKDLEKGTIVISDRYFWSSVAYGITDMNGDGDHLLVAYSILSLYHQFIVPDVTFYLSVQVDETLSRLAEKKEKELYENREKLTKVKRAYEDYLIGTFSDYFTVINGEDDKDRVTEELVSIIEKKLGEKTVFV